MDITRTIAALKKEPGFADNVGMILIHNGVVRAWSRRDRSSVSHVDVAANEKKLAALCLNNYPVDTRLFCVFITQGSELFFVYRNIHMAHTAAVFS